MSPRKLTMALCLATLATAALAQAPATPAAAPPPLPPEPRLSKPLPVGPDGVIDGGAPVYLRPETPEQRKARIGMEVDPGTNPDPMQVFFRFGKPASIHRYERRWANYEGAEPGQVRPYGFVNTYREVYQQNEKWIWVWQDETPPEVVAPVTDPVGATEQAQRAKMTPEGLELFQRMRSEFAPLDVPQSDVTVHFVESSAGLPNAGSYRNSVAVADMNGDGCPDIVAPPQRGIPNGVPEIYLGDCKGNWKLWENVKWPYTLDYGNVVAADFNHDGKLDLAFGVHLTGALVMLGDGKGHFVDASNGLPRDYPTRRVAVADVDHDGLPDLVVISEGPTARGEVNPDFGKLRVYLNMKGAQGWAGMNVAPVGYQFGGDWLGVGNFNGDAYPDFIGSSVYFNGSDILWMSDGPRKWKSASAGLIPLLSYHFANAVGHFTSKKLDDVILSFDRSWPSEQIDPKLIPEPPAPKVIGLDRLTFTGKEPKRVPIVRWPGVRAVWGVAAGDFDGDGNLDVAYTRYDPRTLEILLGDGKGGFTRAKVDGINLPSNTNYDITVADVNGDGRPDIIIAYESAAMTAFAPRDGAIRVYLNRGAEHAPKPAAAEKK
jgi:hypothetical protein